MAHNQSQKPIRPDVRFGSLADMTGSVCDFRFTPKADIRRPARLIGSAGRSDKPVFSAKVLRVRVDIERSHRPRRVGSSRLGARGKKSVSLLGLALVFRCDVKHSRTRLWVTKRLRFSVAFFSACAILLTERCWPRRGIHKGPQILLRPGDDFSKREMSAILRSICVKGLRKMEASR